LADPINAPDYELCRVRTDGSVKWARHHFPLADVLAGETSVCNLPTMETGGHYCRLRLGTLTSRGRFRP